MTTKDGRTTTIKMRRGSQLDWSSANPILEEGEIGVILNVDNFNTRFKIGDGILAWNDLPLYTPDPGLIELIDEHSLDEDAHPQYLKPSELIPGANITLDVVTSPGSVIISAGVTEGVGSIDDQIQEQIQEHVANADAHPQYLKPSELIPGANITLDVVTSPGSVIISSGVPDLTEALSGIQSEVDGKADIGHTHVIGDLPDDVLTTEAAEAVYLKLTGGTVDGPVTFEEAVEFQGHVKVPAPVNSDDAASKALVEEFGIPDGGTTNQILAKASNTDRDVEWTDPPETGESGGEGPTLVQFNALEDRVEVVEAVPPAPTIPQFDALGARVDTLEAVPPAPTVTQFDALEDRVEVVEAVPPAPTIPQFDALGARVDTLEAVPPVTGIPEGGTTGQALLKVSDTDYDVEWEDVAAGTSSIGIPEGGSPGQVIAKVGDTDFDVSWLNIDDLEGMTPPEVVRIGTMTGNYGGSTGSWTSTGGLLAGEEGDLLVIIQQGYPTGSQSISSSGLTFTSRGTSGSVASGELSRSFRVWTARIPDSTSRELMISRTASSAVAATVFVIRGIDGQCALDTALQTSVKTVADQQTIDGVDGVSTRLMAFKVLLMDSNVYTDPNPASEFTDNCVAETSFEWDSSKNGTWAGVQITSLISELPDTVVQLNNDATAVSYSFALSWVPFDASDFSLHPFLLMGA